MALSPLTRRRWQYFKTNRRGYVSLWIFCILFFLTLGAELISNDNPLMISYEGRWYFPVFKIYQKHTEIFTRKHLIKIQELFQKQKLNKFINLTYNE